MSAAPPFASLHGQLAPANPDEPRDQLREKRKDERQSSPRLTAYLNKTLDAIAALDVNENLKIHNEMVKCVAYYDGRWDGKCENGVWKDNQLVTGQILPNDNDYKKQIDKILMEQSRAKILYDIEPIDKSDPAKREAAQFAARRIEVNQNRIETEPFMQDENQSLLLKTWTLRYSFFDKNAESQEKSIEMQAMRAMTEGSEIEVCRTCGMQAERQMAEVGMNDAMPEPYACPHCGDTETKSLVSPPGETIEIAQQKVNRGRVVTVRPDATMVELDLNARDIPSSSFLRWRLVLRRCDWESMFPNTLIPSGDKQSDEALWRSQAQDSPSNSDSWVSSEDHPGGDQFEKIEGELVWLEPKVYQRYASKEAEQLGTHTLKAGEKFSAQFPEGVCVARIAKKILDLYPSNKNKCWTMCVYGKREHALHGSGTMALLGIQDIINEENALILANQVYNSAGRDLVRSGAIEGGQLPSLDKVAYVQNAPEEAQDIARWAHGKIQPSALTTDVYAYREAMRGSLQDAAGTSSLSLQGAADMKALGTATGVEAARDQAVGRIIPNRKLQAHMGAEWVKQILTLEHENYDAEVFLGLANKPNVKGRVEFTERGVRTFFEMEISDFIIKPREGSWVPTSPQQVKANTTEFATVSAMLKQADGGPDKQMQSLLAPNYGIPYDVDEWGADQRAASMRLEEYARVCKGLLGDTNAPPTPDMVEAVLANCAEWARIDPEMDRHASYRDFYQDWWSSDEYRNASPLLRMVVLRVFQIHGEGTVKEQQVAGQAAIDANAPQAEQQAEQAAQMEEAGQQKAVKQALGEQTLKERDRLHEAEVKMALLPAEAAAKRAAAAPKAK